MAWVINAPHEVEEISEYKAIVSICVVLSVLSCLIVGMRLRVRYKNHGLAADDLMALLSEVFAVVYSVLTIMQTRYGLGLPLKLRPKSNLVTYTRINYAGRPFYQLGIAFFKIALLISYFRLLKGTFHDTYRAVVKTAIAFVFLSHLACTLTLIFACSPVEKSWNPLMDGKCLPPGPSFTAYAVVTILCDFFVTLIPIPVLWGLKVRRSKKIGLIGVFALGLFTTVCSIMRYAQINRIQYGDGNSTMLVLWGTIEFNVGNMVSSLPFLAPFFLKKAKAYRKHSPHGAGDKRNLGEGANELATIGRIRLNRPRPVAKLPEKMPDSEENILRQNSITKSAVSVQVSDDGY